MESNNHHFKTKDTALAGWIESQGFELLDIEKGDRGHFLVFENDNPKMEEFIRDFKLGRAEGNILTFYRAYRKMVRRVKMEEL